MSRRERAGDRGPRGRGRGAGRISGRAFDVVSVGYTALDFLGVVPHFPQENLKLELERFEIQGGGPAATAAVTAARLGLSAAFIGTVGDDGFGAAMLQGLRDERVDVSAVASRPGARSQFAFIVIDRCTASRTILWTRGSLAPLAGADLDREMIASCRGLLVDTLEPAAAAEAAALARGSGAVVVIDAGTLREGVREILPHCHYIVASETFARQIAPGGGTAEALEALMAFGPQAAVVTLGERGCVARSRAGDFSVDGFEVEAVDTTGAGDVFHGAFIFAVLAGWDLSRCCVFACAVAALKCRALGGRAGIPTLAQALSFLAERSPGLDFTLPSATARSVAPRPSPDRR